MRSMSRWHHTSSKPKQTKARSTYPHCRSRRLCHELKLKCCSEREEKKCLKCLKFFVKTSGKLSFLSLSSPHIFSMMSFERVQRTCPTVHTPCKNWLSLAWVLRYDFWTGLFTTSLWQEVSTATWVFCRFTCCKVTELQWTTVSENEVCGGHFEFPFSWFDGWVIRPFTQPKFR